MTTMPAAVFSDWLNGFINFEKTPHNRGFSLAVIEEYAEACADPQQSYKSVHIAGSKGKGSTAAMISALLTETGCRTGRYVSPHVNDFRERITENGIFFSDEAYERVFTRVQHCVEQLMESGGKKSSWFELVTLTAFMLFEQEKCDWAVFETGLGGRFDATNIIVPKVSVLTPIELEHCEYLGNTTALIAEEKAGIIKQGVPVFCADQQDEVLAVFRRKAAEMNAPFFYLPEIVETQTAQLTEKGLAVRLHFRKLHPVGQLFSRAIETCLPLFTPVQADNAALAACAVKYLVPDMPESAVETALAKVLLPARFQILSPQPLTVIDGAHTVNSIRYCVETFSKLSSQKPLLVFACAKDKNPSDFAPIFSGKVSKVYLTVPGTFKKGDLPATLAAFSQIFSTASAALNEAAVAIEASEDFTAILREACQKSTAEKLPLLITGSFYLAAEAQRVYNEPDVREAENAD